MHRAVMHTMLALLSVGPAFAQEDQFRASPAYAVGSAHATLMMVSPCLPHPQRRMELEALLNISLTRINRRPEDQAAYQRGVTETQWQQRYIRRSDPVTCNQIGLALSYFVQLNQ